jgi:hypothetical protein
MSRTKTSSRSGTPQGTPNKRRKVVVDEPERKRAKTIKTPRRTTSPLSSSSEDEPLPPRLDISPPEDEPQQILTDSSPITRQVFRPTLIHSETISQRTGEKYKGFIPSTEIVKSSLAKYRPCTSACASAEVFRTDCSPDFPQDGFAIVDDTPPVVELSYPAHGCSEKYVRPSLMYTPADPPLGSP